MNIPTNDAISAANAINKLLNDRSLAEQMGKNGSRAVEEEYNWNKETVKLLALYQM